MHQCRKKPCNLVETNKGNKKTPKKVLHIKSESSNRYHSRFFVQVGHETTYAAIGNHHVSLKHVIVGPTKIIKDLCKAIT